MEIPVQMPREERQSPLHFREDSEKNHLPLAKRKTSPAPLSLPETFPYFQFRFDVSEADIFASTKNPASL